MSLWLKLPFELQKRIDFHVWLDKMKEVNLPFHQNDLSNELFVIELSKRKILYLQVLRNYRGNVEEMYMHILTIKNPVYLSQGEG